MSLKVSNIKLQASSLQTSNAVNNRINGLEKCSYILTTGDNYTYYLSYRNGTKVLSSDLQFNNIILNNVNVILSQNGSLSNSVDNITLGIIYDGVGSSLSSIDFDIGKKFLNRQIFNNNIDNNSNTFLKYYTFIFKKQGENVALLPETLNSITIDVIC